MNNRRTTHTVVQPAPDKRSWTGLITAYSSSELTEVHELKFRCEITVGDHNEVRVLHRLLAYAVR